MLFPRLMCVSIYRPLVIPYRMLSKKRPSWKSCSEIERKLKLKIVRQEINRNLN